MIASLALLRRGAEQSHAMPVASKLFHQGAPVVGWPELGATIAAGGNQDLRRRERWILGRDLHPVEVGLDLGQAAEDLSDELTSELRIVDEEITAIPDVVPELVEGRGLA